MGRRLLSSSGESYENCHAKFDIDIEQYHSRRLLTKSRFVISKITSMAACETFRL